MKKIVCILMIFFVAQIFSQDLRLKEKKLIKLKEKLKDFEELIGKNKSKQKKTISNIKNYSNKKNKTKNLINKFEKRKKGVYSSIKISDEKIKSKRKQIQNLKILCNHELLKLFFLEYENEISSKKNFHENELLKLLINQSATSLSNIIREKHNLTKKKDNQYSEFLKIKSSLKKTESKYSYYNNKSSNLASKLNKLKRENSSYNKELEKIREEKEMLSKLIVKLKRETGKAIYDYKFSSEKLPWPVKGEIIRNFGNYQEEGSKVTLVSNGIDISGKVGDDIKSIDNGKVIYAKWFTGAGKLVIINHQNGFYSLYSHANCIFVSKGDIVSQGDVIAKLGQTGSTEIPCLHFELRKDGISVDPITYLE